LPYSEVKQQKQAARASKTQAQDDEGPRNWYTCWGVAVVPAGRGASAMT
jgi:hypothetical protein